MKSFYLIAWLCIACCLSSSCVREDVSGNSPQDNFESLWRIMDTQYCFFEYKQQEYGLDWDEVHDRYANRISHKMSNEALFEVLSEMLTELRDGHVNLTSASGTSQYRTWYDAYPRNFSDTLQSRYLGKDYITTSGLAYKIMENNIAYVYCGSFSSGIGDGNLTQMLNRLSVCDAMILDVRNNGGGNLTTAQKLAARFTNEKTLVGYMSHKTGRGRNDFSTPEPVYVKPSASIRWQKPVAVLTNRRTYSAANDFVNAMRQFPLVTLIGDKTGGGSGLPFSSEIPNGWSVRFSASPMFGVDKEHLEFGIDPDIKVNITASDYQKGVDTIIETAIKKLKGE